MDEVVVGLRDLGKTILLTTPYVAIMSTFVGLLVSLRTFRWERAA